MSLTKEDAGKGKVGSHYLKLLNSIIFIKRSFEISVHDGILVLVRDIFQKLGISNSNF